MLPVTDVDDIQGGIFKTGLGHTFEGKGSVYEVAKMRIKVKYDSGRKDHKGKTVWDEKEQIAAKIFADGSIAVRKRAMGVRFVREMLTAYYSRSLICMQSPIN